MANTNIGHTAQGEHGNYCTYTVYDNRTDFPVIVGGTAEQCARAMNLTLGSFYCAVTRARNKKIKRWTIMKEYEDGKPDFDHPDRSEE